MSGKICVSLNAYLPVGPSESSVKVFGGFMLHPRPSVSCGMWRPRCPQGHAMRALWHGCASRCACVL
eukprot:8193692-Alexandrium_andersonii.AAC.1